MTRVWIVVLALVGAAVLASAPVEAGPAADPAPIADLIEDIDPDGDATAERIPEPVRRGPAAPRPRGAADATGTAGAPPPVPPPER